MKYEQIKKNPELGRILENLGIESQAMKLMKRQLFWNEIDKDYKSVPFRDFVGYVVSFRGSACCSNRDVPSSQIHGYREGKEGEHIPQTHMFKTDFQNSNVCIYIYILCV